MSEHGGSHAETRERWTLRWLLAINATMFVVELVLGWIAESMGLLADSLDMLADAAVYGVAFLAVGGSLRRKTRAAAVSGILQLVLAGGLAAEVARRALFGSAPASWLMIVVSVVALAANTACLLLLRRHRRGEIHMRASWIFTATDAQANLGVIIAGMLVYWLRSAWPDLVIGSVIVLVAVGGAMHVLREAASHRQAKRFVP